jgi:hypothetical protein
VQHAALVRAQRTVYRTHQQEWRAVLQPWAEGCQVVPHFLREDQVAACVRLVMHAILQASQGVTVPIAARQVCAASSQPANHSQEGSAGVRGHGTPKPATNSRCKLLLGRAASDVGQRIVQQANLRAQEVCRQVPST